MLLSGCAADCLPHHGIFMLQTHEVARIIAGIAAARLQLRQTRPAALRTGARESPELVRGDGVVGEAEFFTCDCRETAPRSALPCRPSGVGR